MPTTTQNKNTFEHSHQPQEIISLQSLHENFVKYKLYVEGFSIKTVESYSYNFKLLHQFKPDIKLTDLTEETIVNFFEYLNTRYRKVGSKQIIRTYKNSTIATVRGKLGSFFNWLIERNYLSENPFRRIRYPDVSFTDPRSYTAKEFEKIVFKINTITWQSLLIKKRNIALIMFLTFTGVRKQELLSLKLGDVNFYEKIIIIRSCTSKSKKSRTIPLHHTLYPYLEDYMNYRAAWNTPYFWVSGTKDRNFSEGGIIHLMEYLSEVTNINCHLHRFRHTFASNYYKQTHDFIGLKKLMGHTSLRMTFTYLRSIPEKHTTEQLHKLAIEDFF